MEMGEIEIEQFTIQLTRVEPQRDREIIILLTTDYHYQRKNYKYALYSVCT